MKFGLIYELQMQKPWEDGAEFRTYHDALTQIELADQVGFDFIWEVEHHFLQEYSHSPAPEVFLAAVSQRTKRLRLGHGIVQTPPGFNHPARIAERIATLDLISNGRVEFGSGESSSEAELGGFGLDPHYDAPGRADDPLLAFRNVIVTPHLAASPRYNSLDDFEELLLGIDAALG